VQVGPEALALAALSNKQMGLSLGHTHAGQYIGIPTVWSTANHLARINRLELN